jgi:hypothetical protein
MNRALSTLGVMLVPLATLTAQESATTPFRDGQWAAQFGWESGLGSLGVLAFTGPTGAWLLDVQFEWINRTFDIRDAFGPDTSGDADYLDVAVRVGRRFYQARGAKVVTYQSIGVLGTLFERRTAFLAPPGATRSERSNGFGAFGEMGAAYAITQNLSIGLTGTVGVQSVTFKQEEPSGTRFKSSGFAVSAPALMFVATIYF